MLQGKLELTWVNKYFSKKVAPRVLVENEKLSYGSNITENMLIKGDNLVALKSLEKKYSGLVKCIYIDPPYNTGNAFEHYEDGLEHSIWLTMMHERLIILHQLLSEDGSIWISIDDDESHYLKILCDEVFGRNNFVSNVIWEKKSSPSNDARWISDTHDHILVYAKDKNIWRPNKLPRTSEHNKIYKHSDEHDGIDESGNYYGRGPWFPGDMTVKTININSLYPVTTPSGRIVKPAEGRAWVYNENKFIELQKDNRITFGKGGSNKPCIKRFITEIEDKGIVPKSVWHYTEVGENRNARQEVKKFNSSDPFSTPKPEKLIQRILNIATLEGDLVLDSFAGSGTTGAVAHKMNRKWIMVEMNGSSEKHCLPRLRKVIDGKDDGGITENVGWRGGGGFKYYELSESLLIMDRELDTLILNPNLNDEVFNELVCTIEGFYYKPEYKFHGYSSEKHYAYVTKEIVTMHSVTMLKEQLKTDEYLTIYCTKRADDIEKIINIDIRKIPFEFLSNYEYEE